MKRLLIILMFFLSIGMFAQENKFVKSAQTENAKILQIGDSKAWCSICGMNLKMFYKTNHAFKLDDGTSKQYCSIRCLVADKSNHEGHIVETLVSDAKTEKLIDVTTAHYVIGSKAPGTMTKVSKIAFSNKEDAVAFSKKYSGKSILNFDATFALSKKQMVADNKMLMKQKEMKVYPKGKKLYGKLCNKDIALPKFEFIADLKSHLKDSNVCKKLNEKELQMVALYLWEVRSKDASTVSVVSIDVPKDVKCPVCGMFVYKYPRWAAVLDISLNDKIKKLYFDGVKDLMKFYMNPEEWGKYKGVKILKISVTEYYTQTEIDGKKAIYVINSDIYGPMGNELIPFSSKEDAAAFIQDHSGKVVKNFVDVTPEMIKKLDE
ncbi:MAG: nitrous oxide reductase [Ignavibacteriae bacterium]|nr:nitrous oxide reductase [Ignavibacteriota bacterium]